MKTFRRHKPRDELATSGLGQPGSTSTQQQTSRDTHEATSAETEVSSISRPGYDEHSTYTPTYIAIGHILIHRSSECRNVLVRYCAHIPRNYQYKDGIHRVRLLAPYNLRGC